MPLARGAAPARRDPPETRRHLATKEEDGRIPPLPSAVIPPTTILFLRHGHRPCPDLDPLGKHPGLHVAPERDQKPPCHCHDSDPTRAALQCTDTLAEPCGERAARLVAQPQPGKLDQAGACPRVPRPAYASIAVYPTALVGHRCDADVTGELATVGERPI